MSDSPEQKEKHKLARERLRRLRALAKLRKLQRKESAGRGSASRRSRVLSRERPKQRTAPCR